MKIIKETLSEQIYNSLRMDIITRKISLGEKLVNRDLQEKFGVSSTPIRDAINHLHQDGLITEVTRVGAKVIELDLKTSNEVNEILSILNCAAMKMSMERSDAKQVVAQLRKNIQLQLKNIDNDGYFTYDYLFHKTFFDFAKNENCKALYKRYHSLHEMLVYYYHDQFDSKIAAIDRHKKITDAYEATDLKQAQQEMEDHHICSIREVKKYMLEVNE